METPKPARLADDTTLKMPKLVVYGERIPGRMERLSPEVLTPRVRPRTYQSKHRLKYVGNHRAATATTAYDPYQLFLVALVWCMPILAIPAHTFGWLDIAWTAAVLVVPTAFTFFFFAILFESKALTLAMRGLATGLVAVALYDLARFLFIYMGVLDEFFGTLGGLITGNGEEHLFVGYIWRYIGDGGGIGVVFFVVATVLWCSPSFSMLLLRERQFYMMMFGIGYGIFVWLGLMATVTFSPGGPGLLFTPTLAPTLATLAGHIIYGAVLGGMFILFQDEEKMTEIKSRVSSFFKENEV